ncbi:MAG: radical SAM protein [Candidatus Omnitrophica bacterium]|nr:radical SAM protein [Candidatus Omnitrophota bacterium]
MTKKQYFLTLIALLKAKLLGKGTPLIINWAITNKCNNQCGYCNLGQQNVLELTTAQIFKIIDILHKSNTLWINFSGGEPLIRLDIQEIISYTASKGINIILNTNGFLLAKKQAVLDKVQVLKLSFDGPVNIHDKIRGEGSFAQLMQAIKIVKQSKVKLLLCAVLSQANLDYIDYILNTAKDLNSMVFFQPATKKTLGSSDDNPLYCETVAYRQAMSKLLSLKKSKSLGKYIANSASALECLDNWCWRQRLIY